MTKLLGHALITGGSGYIGSYLTRRLIDMGWAITQIGRRPPTIEHPNLRYLEWSMGCSVPREAFDSWPGVIEVDRVFHLAYDRSSYKDPDTDVNIISTKRLIRESKMRGITEFLLASSIVARDDALNVFGRKKAEITRLVLESGYNVAQIGLVYGGEHRGMWGEIISLLRKSHILPMVSPSNLVQPIHITEVCKGLIYILDFKNYKKQVFILASPAPLSFGEFLKTTSKVVLGRGTVIVPVPMFCALWGARIINMMPFVPNIDEERILGLAGVPVLDCENDLKLLGVEVKSIQAGMYLP